MITFGSLFSGVGGFDLGFERAGMRCEFQCEIDPKAGAVLARHWPDVTRYEDVRNIGKANLQPVDLICGGFPCQDLSVAGKRAGLDGERSGLWFEYHRILAELRPRWVVIENVPGLLSSAGGWDFAAVLRGLGELGYYAAWRVLDAQYFGLAQRRRRVFIVASLGDGRCAEVLFEREGVCGDTPPRRQAGQGATRSVAPSLTSNYGKQPDNSDTGLGPMLIAGTLTGQMQGMSHQWAPWNEADNLIAFQQNTRDEVRKMGGDGQIAGALAAQAGMKQQNYIAFQNTGHGYWNDNEAGETLRSHADQSTNLVAYGGNNTAGSIDVATACNAHGGTGRHDFESETFVTYGMATSVTPKYGYEVAPTLTIPSPTGGGQPPATAGAFGVRRLTPTECERLQGFPDGWTEYGVLLDRPVIHTAEEFVGSILSEDPKLYKQSDSSRYRQLGNAVAVPVIEWLGRRIVAVEAQP
jgi:DNA (cytosine-5)-methyltransferase 1